MADELDKFTRHAHYVERYKTHQANQIEKFLKKIDKYVRDQLSRSTTIPSRERLRDIQKSIRLMMKDTLADWQEQLELELAKFGVAEATYATKAIEGVLLSTIPSETQLIAAIRARPYASVLLKQDFSDFTRKQVQLINNAIAQGFFAGENTGDIIRRIRGTKANNFRDGIIHTTFRQASTLTRTSIQHTANVAKELVYENNADLFTHYQWVSVLDSRTSPICQDLSGEVFKVGKGPTPPAHRNCRSTTVPVFDEEITKKDGKLVRKQQRGELQASQFGQVSANLNYGQWLKRQSAEFIDDVLGKTRGKLFRSNKLPLDRYIENGKPIPLDELIKKYKLSLGG